MVWSHQQVIYVYLHKHNQRVALICHIQKNICIKSSTLFLLAQYIQFGDWTNLQLNKY